MPRFSKAGLARHLSMPHGEASVQVPLEELRRWSRAELEQAHASLQAQGPCPSFRSKIITKSA